MEITTATNDTNDTTTARLAPLAALALFIAYSVLVTTSSGDLSAVCSPLVIIAIGLLVWHDTMTEG